MLTIDTNMHGSSGITGTFLVQGERTALVETGCGSSLPSIVAGLEAAGVESLDWILVTHIHLDHAGAAGALARLHPGARVGVHHVGARHLVDPSKLMASAARIYGDDMDRLWGTMEPIDEDRIVAFVDGDRVDLGGDLVLEAIETPGHAGHHHAYLDHSSGNIFTGDALGVRLPDVGVVRPATPPPEFDMEACIKSIERIRDLEPTALTLTHFGPAHEGVGALGVSDTCEAAIDAVRNWAAYVTKARETTDDLDEVTRSVRAEVESTQPDDLPADAVERMEQTTSYWMNSWGYMRYFDKRAGA